MNPIFKKYVEYVFGKPDKGEQMKYSNCCCAPPWGETCDDLGFCSECMEHAVFEGEENEGI